MKFFMILAALLLLIGFQNCGKSFETSDVPQKTSLSSETTPESPILPPAAVAGFKSIAIGEKHICGISLDNKVQCWGDNSKYQLGNNLMVSSTAPVDVAGLVNVKALSSAHDETCAITEQNNVKCWGGGSLASSALPADISNTSGAKSIYTSNMNCIVTDQNIVKCWGINDSNKSAVEMAGLTDIKAVALGYTHNCALTNQGTVKCWGSNQGGQLGNNSRMSSNVPVDVVGLSNIKSISVGQYGHSCAITARDSVMCWGFNNTLQLGEYYISDSLVPINVKGLTVDGSAKKIATGATHSCVVTAEKKVKCWGDNGLGQSNPALMGTNNGVLLVTELENMSDIEEIFIRGQKSCALNSQGSIKCWGKN